MKCKNCGETCSTEMTEMTGKTTATFYLHSSKESVIEQFEELAKKEGGIVSEEALQKLMYTGYEVTFDVLIDWEAHEVRATHVNGQPLVSPVVI